MNAAVPYPIQNPLKELALNGVCKYLLDNRTIHIQVEEVLNLRGQGNLSGTLVLEVWALPQRYAGGDFSGYLLASQTLGELAGQHCLRQCDYALPISEPEAGVWEMVLMLREWHNGAYITRDYINFQYRLRAENTIALSLEGV
ncbi:hypothetical protein [Oceanobacter mangrovi]|uniref:hypothetical protein n=1 Tax=Oceanobacter mangrovi TaxID=2862510 RepID=UPI001C8D9DF7|nr:hypothetical protein [Oceanobacter mangrovi]